MWFFFSINFLDIVGPVWIWLLCFLFFSEGSACFLCSFIGFDRCSAVIDECILLWNPSHNIILEGPYFVNVNIRWFLLYIYDS